MKLISSFTGFRFDVVFGCGRSRAFTLGIQRLPQGAFRREREGYRVMQFSFLIHAPIQHLLTLVLDLPLDRAESSYVILMRTLYRTT